MQIVLNFKQSIVNEILVDYMLVTIIRKPLAANDKYDDDNDDDDVSTVVYHCYECFTQRTFKMFTNSLCTFHNRKTL